MNSLGPKKTDREIVVIRRGDLDLATSAAQIFEGGIVSSTGLPVLEDVLVRSAGDEVTCSLVRFAPLARTRFHTHAGDQLLLITAGAGYVGTRNHVEAVSAGDVVVVPAGLTHFHGGSDESMEHLTILFGSRTDVSDGHSTWPPRIRLSE